MTHHLSRSVQVQGASGVSATRRRPDEASPLREETFRQMMLLHEAQKVVSWVPDSLADRCYHCQAMFSLVLRRHHCRRCGNVFCDGCSSSRMPLVSAGFFTPVRVCDKCCDAAKKTHRRMYNERRRLSQSVSSVGPAHGSIEALASSSHHDLHTLLTLSPMDESETYSNYTASPAGHALTTMIDVIPGEVVMYRGPNVRLRCIPNGCEYAGTVYISNYRLVFSQTAAPCLSTSEACARTHSRHATVVLQADHVTTAPRYHAIPLRTIERVKRQELAESDTGNQPMGRVLTVFCKDLRRVQLVFLGLVKQQTFSHFDRCDRELRGRGGATHFAKVHQEQFPRAVLDGWTVYDPVAEFNRLGVGATTKWRITDINQTYSFCPTYSASIAVPAAISDDVLATAGAFRSKARIPALTWRDKKSGATICRSSQPLVGLGQKQCAEDILLIQAIAATNPSSSTMVIVDARPWRNAMAQKTVGMAGYELTAHYEVKTVPDKENAEAVPPSSPPQPSTVDRVVDETVMLGPITCRLVFMGIENIHVMRKSFQKLTDLCLAPDPLMEPPGRWHEQLAQTKWMDHLSRILHAAVEIVRLVKTDTASVLVHCSDGWDRTSQVTALAELMLDPYYRTIRGFALLVEKDWCSFGYKFCERTGHVADPNSQEISVVFVQWMDCVWQMCRQFPCSFEFNTRFLILVLDHLYSCRFGTFLYDSEQRRVVEERQAPTTSLWTYLSSLERSFITNPFYEPRKYSRQNWHARVVERRQANEFPMSQWQQPVEDHHHAPVDGHGLVGLEEKEDGVVIVHTDSSQHLEALASPHHADHVASDDLFGAKRPKNGAAFVDDIKARGGKPKKKFHSIVQDLDAGLMFPHVIETVATPLSSPAYASPLMDYTGGADEDDDVDLELLPRDDSMADDEPGHLDARSSTSSSSSSCDESEGSQASSKDVPSFGPDADVLLPSVSVKCLRLWTEYYLRWEATATIDRNGDLEREAKLRDVLAELEYYKKQQRRREPGGSRRRGRRQPRRSSKDDDDGEMVGLAMEDLFEVESRQVVAHVLPPLSAPPATRSSALSLVTLRAHNHRCDIAQRDERHRQAMDRMQMPYEDLISQQLQHY
ncbi:hypothetical protein H310_08740 [Aphanomyces invadans]|uniref:phosphatidylinositol-3,5-bisphosphate 3-phosphatase n=1 Tax=Aphanomyces invadans TaxID=157072 RepID=A0A024TX70_9STRA|nr:hypothetical protein H310_08740 [Aphanomyces invadans]ETV98623.1 hypothetical protein H310_08740 [Aphanomyces invadans]|eukprot:XP_008872820.1 hypothetical protein H310_08740 [Aphanomyces invadans]